MIKSTVYFGNGNNFTIDLKPKTVIGELWEVFPKIIMRNSIDLLYIICNGSIIGSFPRISFDKKLSELPLIDNKCVFYLIFNDNATGIDRIIQNTYLSWRDNHVSEPRRRRRPVATGTGADPLNAITNIFNSINGINLSAPLDHNDTIDMGYETLVNLPRHQVLIPQTDIPRILIDCDIDETISGECFCGTPLTDSTKIISRVDTCGHIFHRDCVTEWLTGCSVNCPVCHADVRISHT